MREDLTRDLLPGPGEGIDPVEMARRDQRKTLPKRFYKEAGSEPVEHGFGLLLDGRPALTPARNRLVVPTQSLMQALVGEWNGQTETIDPATMPLTRILNSALDGVARELGPVRDEILKYAGTDLLVYRAGEPQHLVEEQPGIRSCLGRSANTPFI
jgi:chaperone required for assembly of F1-ATPase